MVVLCEGLITINDFELISMRVALNTFERVLTLGRTQQEKDTHTLHRARKRIHPRGMLMITFLFLTYTDKPCTCLHIASIVGILVDRPSGCMRRREKGNGAVRILRHHSSVHNLQWLGFLGRALTHDLLSLIVLIHDSGHFGMEKPFVNIGDRRLFGAHSRFPVEQGAAIINMTNQIT